MTFTLRIHIFKRRIINALLYSVCNSKNKNIYHHTQTDDSSNDVPELNYAVRSVTNRVQCSLFIARSSSFTQSIFIAHSSQLIASQPSLFFDIFSCKYYFCQPTHIELRATSHSFRDIVSHDSILGHLPYRTQNSMHFGLCNPRNKTFPLLKFQASNYAPNSHRNGNIIQ